jgi:hypothetical protein
MELHQFNVNDRASFIEFINVLRKDLKINKDEWENIELDDFLEAIGRYTEDIDGYYHNTGQLEENADQASWKRFADIFQGARIYE